MKCIGIDVSKDTLDLCWGEDFQKFEQSKIENSKVSLAKFLKKHPLKPADWIVAMESTGDYHRLATIFFLKQGFKVKIINPIQTDQFKRKTIRAAKTDKLDSEKIFKLVFVGEGREVTLEELNNPKKELLRLSHFVTKLKSQMKLKFQSVQTKNLVDQETKEDIMELIERMEEIIENLDDKALSELNDQGKLIDTIPGFSAKLSEVIVAECGDITKFKDANALVAYAGLDPKPIQSGSSVNRYGHISKRGSTMLRYALFLAARVAWRYDSQLQDYYQKKRGEGRSFTEVICMISRKLIHRIYAVVKEQRPYETRLSMGSTV
jgi:transposase